MSEKQLTVLLFVIFGVQVLLGGTGIWYYQFYTIPDLQAQLQTAKTTQQDFQQKANQIKGLETAIANVKKEIAELTERIPKFGPGENDALADLVDKIRKRSRVNIAGLRYKTPQGSQPGMASLPPGLFKAQYEVGIKGSFYHLLNFIFHVESEHRFLTVENITINAGSSAEGSRIPARDLLVTLTTFMSRDPMQQPPPTEGTPTPSPTPSPSPTPTPEPEKKTSTPPPD